VTEAESRDLILNALVSSNVLTADRQMELGRDPGSDVELAALGIDSMAVINLCVALEETLHRDVEIEELIEHPSLNLLARHIAARSLQGVS
jgi:acyl carrier protein